MSRIKLVVSDLDGTLLLNGAQSLEPEIFPLIRRMKEKGIMFFAASGRQYPNLRRLFAPVQDAIGYICENGCVAFWEGRLLFASKMEPELGNEIMSVILQREGEEILRSGLETSYLQPKEESFLYHIRDVVKNNVTVVDNIFSVKEPFSKISVYDRKGIEKSVRFWKERFQERASVVVSDKCWIDLTPRGTNKGKALEAVCDRLGIVPGECMAFGDNENDLEMLQFAGDAWGMETCHPKVKRLCSKFTPRVDAVLLQLLQETENREKGDIADE